MQWIYKAVLLYAWAHRNIIGRIYQSIPISITVEGANILTRSLIIFGQGAMRCHPNILKIVNSTQMENRQEAVKIFDRLLFKQMVFVSSNLVRTFITGLTNARFIVTPVKTREKKYYQQLSRMSSAFALLSDVFITSLGSELKRKEKVSGRLGDILSELYIASSVLKHYQNQGEHPQDYDLLQWSCESSLYNIESSIEGLLQNYPVKAVGWILKKIIFPYGKQFKKSSDKLGTKIARKLLEPCPTRFRLTHDIFIPHTTSDQLGRIESALTRVIAAEPIEKFIRESIKKKQLSKTPPSTLLERAVINRIITPEQANIVKAADIARHDVIMVDEFSADFKVHYDPVTSPLDNDDTVVPLNPTHDQLS